MIRIFRHYVPASLLVIGLLEHVLMIVSIYLALMLRWANTSDITATIIVNLPQALTFASVFSFVMLAVGLYHKEHMREFSTVLSRLVFGFGFGFDLPSQPLFDCTLASYSLTTSSQNRSAGTRPPATGQETCRQLTPGDANWH